MHVDFVLGTDLVRVWFSLLSWLAPGLAGQLGSGLDWLSINLDKHVCHGRG